tara:strand:- start:239 stop:397 length:159 start_codon:yes stop_codon:yes gene_type:complete
MPLVIPFFAALAPLGPPLPAFFAALVALDAQAELRSFPRLVLALLAVPLCHL